MLLLFLRRPFLSRSRLVPSTGRYSVVFVAHKAAGCVSHSPGGCAVRRPGPRSGLMDLHFEAARVGDDPLLGNWLL